MTAIHRFNNILLFFNMLLSEISADQCYVCKRHSVPSTVGEPLNDEAWLWYHNVVGGGKCTVVDTWWQTGILLCPHMMNL